MSEDEIIAVSCGYFVNDGVLMRKWTSPKMTCQDDWSSVFQVVAPSAYCPDILHLAHYHCLAGNMRVRKTLDRVLRHLFWLVSKMILPSTVEHVMCAKLLVNLTRKSHLYPYTLFWLLGSLSSEY